MKQILPVSGKLFILSGPSGVGKTTVVRRLLAEVPNLVRSISATTRPRRPGEQEGVDYFFLSDPEFAARAASGEFLESAEVFGHRYGTPRTWVQRELSAGRSVILAIDVQGAEQVRNCFSPVVSFFLMPPDLDTLRARLDRRGSDAPQDVDRRLRTALGEIARKDQYDYVVVNDALDGAVRKIRRQVETILHTPPASLLP